MAFGFVVVKFALFVKQFAFLVGNTEDVPQSAYSGIVGVALIVFGVAIALFAYLQFRRTQKQLTTGSYQPVKSLPLILISFILVIGAILLVYLMQYI